MKKQSAGQIELKKIEQFDKVMLKREIKKLGGAVKMHFNNFGKVKPAIIMFIKEKDGIAVGGGALPEEQIENRKEALFLAGHSMRHEKKDVRAIMFSAEAWYRIYDEKESAAMKKLGITPSIMRPSQSPNRKEAVLVTAMNKQGELAIMMYDIVEKDGKRVCVEKKEMNQDLETAQDNLLSFFWKGFTSDCGNEVESGHREASGS